tara:strand:- start:405 stop:686 length:282 start_codon:yes stop_codon:yes gene_type:complete
VEKNKNLEYIEKLIADIDDPIVSESGGFSYLGLIESLILNSTYEIEYQNKMIDSLDALRKSEADALCFDLKQNQIIRDPKHQFEKMAKDGIFK